MSWSIVGHQWAVSILRQQILQGRVRHAYLFTGADNLGKETLARRFAQALICSGEREPAGFCGSCRDCRHASGGGHPDLHVVASADDSSSLQVDQIRELQRQLALTPFEAQKRVALLLGFHESTEGAGNALLKLLEEPPPHVILMITARSAEALLPTIVSRCERLQLRPVPRMEIEQALLSRGSETDKAELLSCVADGRPGLAFSLLEDDGSLEVRSEQLDDLLTLMGQNRGERLLYAGKFKAEKRGPYKDAGEARAAAQAVIEAWRPLLRAAMLEGCGMSAGKLLPDRRQAIERTAARYDVESLRRALIAMQQALQAFDHNANSQLTMETLMLKLPGLQQPAAG